MGSALALVTLVAYVGIIRITTKSATPTSKCNFIAPDLFSPYLEVLREVARATSAIQVGVAIVPLELEGADVIYATIALGRYVSGGQSAWEEKMALGIVLTPNGT